MLAVAAQTLAITAPVFAMLFLGVALKRLRWIDTPFIDTASSLVFRGTMPTLLFLGVFKADLDAAMQPQLLSYFFLATVASFFVAWAWAIWRVPFEDRGIYTQGAFRGNNGIVGLALATSMYGDYGLSVGSLLAALAILCYNALSAVVLAIYSPGVKPGAKAIARSIVTNPMIIGVLLAVPIAYWKIPLPQWFLTSAEYFAQMTLPLALICIGGTLSLASLRRSSGTAIGSGLMKMVWLPLLSTFGAWLFGFRGADLAILFLYFASPTAAASFVMARAVGANHELAAAIIVITTLAAVVATNIGLLLLQWGGWI
ncbi:AEC family transporter [Ectopseudomonas oleovorans]|jgi:predicted permease|uniref:AEC family transporter n=2 Tax=Ectopseudomonas oleovorans TaxID=301 RepID=A0A061CNG2_ECTOL|nr:AEC family transporter [Pseudomonas oleovorans]MBQ1556670.1 AEC family transporter [Pseudomonas sp.]MBN7118021.1 malate transporter [Pseudomonas oleovorans]MBN7132709.1 malate transporter [Pseudomonas oleovorans]MBN7139073.1 malate transporter [Pseudomonas oleovorans]MDG9977900.1 AEC family transporter [Pseudomonas oleovorans]